MANLYKLSLTPPTGGMLVTAGRALANSAPSRRLGATLADLLLPASPADLNLPRTRSLGDRQRQSQDAIVVARADVLRVDRRAEPELAAKRP
jgi:hypothetical protein